MLSARYKIGFVLIGLIMIAAIGVYIYHAVNTALEAEVTLGTNRAMLHVLEVYMIKNPGRWPQSWEELERTSIPDEEQRFRHWPNDIDEFKKRVHVEFGLTLQEVADMLTPEKVRRWDFDSFTVVRPIGPNYGPCESELAHFMKVVWEQNSKGKQKARDPEGLIK
jgi:hypothetical protein